MSVYRSPRVDETAARKGFSIFCEKKNKKRWDEISIKDLQENIKRWNLGAIKIISHTEDAVMKVTRRMLGPKFLPEQSNSFKKLFNKFLFYEHLKKLLKIWQHFICAYFSRWCFLPLGKQNHRFSEKETLTVNFVFRPTIWNSWLRRRRWEKKVDTLALDFEGKSSWLPTWF